MTYLEAVRTVLEKPGTVVTYDSVVVIRRLEDGGYAVAPGMFNNPEDVFLYPDNALRAWVNQCQSHDPGFGDIV